MHPHLKSITITQPSCLISRSYTLSERPQRSPSYFNNHPSCHLQDYIQTQHSFRPEIHELPMDIYPNRSKVEVSRDERFERLIDNQLEKQEGLYQRKITKEEEEVERHCTFQPNLLARGVEYDEEVFDRLYDEGMEKQKEKQRVTPKISSECTFQPNTNRVNILNSEKTNLEPIYLRFKEEVMKKLERKEELKKRIQQQNIEKLAPFTINEQSERIIEQKQNFNKNVVSRLLSYMKEAEYKNKVRQEEKEHKLNQMTFTPEINPVTIPLPGEDFVERQQILAQQSRQKINIRQSQIIKRQCPFKPKVSVISDYLINIKRADQAKQDKIERMFYQYPQIKQQNLQKLEEQIYRQCTFHPQINQISRQLDANHIHHCCDRPHEKHYPHKPKLNQNSLKMAASRKRNSSMTSFQTKTDKIKMELEYKQMKECTFRPKTLTGVIKSETNVNKISGFNNFMRTKELKLKQELQQKLVEEKLFRMEKRYDMRVEKETKMNEFKLSKTNKDVNHIFEEDLKRFQENCPFRPNSNKEKKAV